MSKIWTDFLKSNPEVVAYFHAQNINEEKASEQLDAVLENTTLSKASKRKSIGLMVFWVALGAVSIPISGFFGPFMAALMTLSEYGALSATKKDKVREYTKSLAKDFAQSAKWAEEFSVENTYQPKPLISKSKPVKLVA